MKAQISSVFYLILFVSVAFLSSYIIYTLNTRNANLLSKDLIIKTEQTRLPVYDIRDVKYEESGSVGTLSFTLVNMGDVINLKGWILEFLSGDLSKLICRTMVLTGDPLEASRIASSFTVINKNVSLDVGGNIYGGDVVNVEFTLLSTCLNETIAYTRANTKMVVRLTIPSVSRTVLLTCSVDPYTGFASCSE